MSSIMGKDDEMMARAIRNADRARISSSPNPWVGSVLVTPAGEIFDGATSPVGGDHAEAECLAKAGSTTYGATLYSTL